MRIGRTVICGLVVALLVCCVPCAASRVVPLCPAGTPFASQVYAQDTPHSDPMVFPCYWDGTGHVSISGDRSAIAGTWVDDEYTLTVQPGGAVYRSEGTGSFIHPSLDITSGMTPGLNTFTLVIDNTNGLSMSYGSQGGFVVTQAPYLVQVIADSRPTVTIISPESGPESGGTLVTINGTGFTGATAVRFGTRAGTDLTVVAPNQITVRSPAHAGGIADVRVTTPGGSSPVVPGDTFTYVVLPPAVTAITPASANQGTTVQVTGLAGTGFKNGAKVYLTKSGSPPINATNISVLSPTSITCTFRIPLHGAIGPWNVRVNNTDGRSGTKVNAFTIKTPAPPTVTGITPASGTQGTTVQVGYLAGTGFALLPKPAVQLVRDTGTINASNITVINPDRMTCTFRIPAAATPGSWAVRVTNADGQEGTKADAFQVRAPPAVTEIDPESGVRGTTVQVTNLSGNDFYTGAKVFLTRTGSSPLMATNVTVESPQKITCTVRIPAGTTIGPWNVTVRNTDGRSGTTVNAFTVKTPAPPAVTGITPPSGIRGTTVQVTDLSGTGFAPDPPPTVQLVKNGTTITATNITVVSPDSMTCTFTISPYAVTGPWNVRVTNADRQYGVKTGAFTVES